MARSSLLQKTRGLFVGRTLREKYGPRLALDGEVVFQLTPWHWRYISNDLAFEFHMEANGDVFWIDAIDPFRLISDPWADFDFVAWFSEDADVLNRDAKHHAIDRFIAALARDGKVAEIWPSARSG